MPGIGLSNDDKIRATMLHHAAYLMATPRKPFASGGFAARQQHFESNRPGCHSYFLLILTSALVFFSFREMVKPFLQRASPVISVTAPESASVRI